MGIIYINIKKSKKQNKKPGWKKEEEQYKKWLDNINSMQLFPNHPKVKIQSTKKENYLFTESKSVRQETLVTSTSSQKQVKNIFFGSCGKPIDNPYVLYKDNPEMLERELRARQRKFTTAQIYNKGPYTLVTDDIMKDITSGSTRRRN